MKFIKFVALSAFSLSLYSSTSLANENDQSGFIEGGKVYTLVNIHADYAKNNLYSMNYQQAKLIPICSEFTIEDIDNKKIKLTHQDTQYNYLWDKYTRKGGQSLEENFKQFFGKSCDEVKLKITKLSKINQDGIVQGKPLVGMSKEGVFLAMGQPPRHATPSLEANTWLYWTNKWAKDAIEFDENGKVKNIID